jgi:hypothetical protein
MARVYRPLRQGNLYDLTDHYHAWLCRWAIRKHGGWMKLAAAELGLSPTTFYALRRRLGLNDSILKRERGDWRWEKARARKGHLD